MEKAGLQDCTCEKCVTACEQRPGWFAPGEAEKAAKFLGIPFDEFKKRLIIDYWCGSEDIPLYSPRKCSVEEERTVASWGYAFTHGRCVFLKDGLCSIHPVKPFECRHSMPCNPKPESERKHIAEMWEREGNPLA